MEENKILRNTSGLKEEVVKKLSIRGHPVSYVSNRLGFAAGIL
jgi:hypothetical protein